ncbi:unnamed protein product [Clavelina lepadiformis]|uniref:Uncharacterized protein n=1 Tax=Clavelina lepadiformis TaxID=159417 RepID=A0ABP0GKZ1_CLALP
MNIVGNSRSYTVHGKSNNISGLPPAVGKLELMTMGGGPSSENSNEVPTEDRGWEMMYAELVHDVTSKKAWPGSLRKGANVKGNVESELKCWTVWRSPDKEFAFVFGVKCKNTKKYFYIKPNKNRRRKIQVKLSQGKNPSKGGLKPSDKRIFHYKCLSKSNQQVLQHAKTGRYLICTKKGELKLQRNEKYAQAWMISEQNEPTEV